MATRIILDCDPGIDDALAIAFAHGHPDIDLVGITTVAGNVGLARTTANALTVCEYIGAAGTPVTAGCAGPLLRPALDARQVHGESGLGGAVLPAPTASPAPGHAIDHIIETIRAAPGQITLVATGPLTNVALALKLDPSLAARIPKLVIMGGGHEVPNVTPSAEFNIWADPEGAAVVLGSGIAEIILVPLDSTHRALISLEDCAAFRALGSPAGEATARFVQRRIEGYDATQPMSRLGAAPVHDALCVAYLIDPAVIPLEKYYVDVETDGPLTVGRTVVDTHRRSGKEPNVWVSLDADEKKFRDIMLAAFAAR